MRGRHTLVWILVVSPLAAMAGCGGGENLPPEPTTDPSINLTGTFIGQVTASLPTGTDVTKAVLQLAQSGSSISGTYSADNGRSATVSGSLSGRRLTLAVTFTDTCAGSASATGDITNSATRLAGNYTANDCLGNYTGGFAFDKQSAPAGAASVTITPGSATLPVGSTVQLTATPKDASGNPLAGRAVVWTSSSASVATVSPSGLVTGVARGGATVTATTESKAASAAITVTSAPLGEITVLTETSGTSLDPDGYTIIVEGGTAQPIGINGTIAIPGLQPGDHSVLLTGIANNCVAVGSNPRTVTVTSGSTAQTTFSITCVTDVGSIELITATTGANPDPDGYTLLLDGSPKQSIGANASVTLTGVAAGDHSITLTGLAGNCTVGGTHPRSVTVLQGSTAQVDFQITCTTNLGNIEVITSTIGADLDPDGYTVSVDGGQGQAVGVNDVLTISGLAAGDHTIELSGAISNCTISEENPRTARVTSGATTQITFLIVCSELHGTIEVTTSTSGANPDPDGYAVSVDGGQPQPIGVNTTLTISGIMVGGHSVQLSGVADDCTVDGTNHRSVTVASGSTIQVTFEISCSSTPPPPPPEPTLAFAADPPTITVGQSSVLNWSATDASQCNASDSWMGNKPLSGSELVSPTSTATYTLTCSGSGGSVTKSVAVTVNAPPPPPPPPLPNCTHTADVTRTPDYQPYKPLMEQVVPAGPVYVTSSTAVAECALLDAGYMLQTILRNRADVASALRDNGTLTGVFGLNESVCDLPYFSDLRQLDPEKCDARGGLGGVIGRYATACSEANLLKDPADPYGRGTRPDGENVCVHELGHSIMNIGLSDADRAAIRQRFDAVKSEGQLWAQDAFGNPTFALANADEFWAEITQVYFCANPAVPAFLHNGVNCADQLQQYDFETFRLVDGIYRLAAADLQ